MELNFEGLEMQKWNIPTDRAQRWDGKNGVICLVMFTPKVMVVKMSKIAHFLYFLLMPAKNQSQFGQNTYVHLKDLIQLSQKMIWIVGFWDTISKILTLEDTEFHYFLLTQQIFGISILDILQTITPKPFSERTQKDLLGALFKCFT